MTFQGVPLAGVVITGLLLGTFAGWFSAALQSSNPTPGRSLGTPAPSAPATITESSTDRWPDGTPFDARLDQTLSIRSKMKRSQAIDRIAEGLDVPQIRSALTLIERTHIPEREDLLRALFSRWAELEPEAALAYAAGTKDECAFRMVGAAARSWARKDMQQALDAISRTPGNKIHRSALASILEVLSETDPEQALDLAKKHGIESGVSQVLFENWAEKNPEQAADYALKLPSGFGRNNAVGSLARTWAELDLPAARHWLESLSDTDAVGNDSWSSPANAVISAWIERDPDAALRWLEEMPAGPRKSGFLKVINTEMEDPAVFARYVALLPPDRQDHWWIGFAQSRGENDLAATLAWARQQPREMQDRTIPNLARMLALDDPAKALELAAALGESVREEATGEVLEWWARKDPKAAAHWAQQHQPNAANLKGVAVSFITRDLSGATEWANKLPASPAKDEMINWVSERIQQQNPQLAASWIEGISDDAKREDAYEQLGTTWFYCDPAAAKAWLESAPVDPAFKALMLKQIAK